MQVCTGGGSARTRQAPQRRSPSGTGAAQTVQREVGPAKRCAQASHTGCLGQAPHTWQMPGKASSSVCHVGNMGRQYTGPPFPVLPPAGRRLNMPSVPETAVPGLDPVAALRWRRRARNESPWLHEEVATRMAERLHWFREQPASWLHWEPVAGGLRAHRYLRGLLPQAPCHFMAERPQEAWEATREEGRAGLESAQLGPPKRPGTRRRTDPRQHALGQHAPAHGAAPADADPALARAHRNQWLSDVLVSGSGQPARTSTGVRATRLARARSCLHGHARLGAICWFTADLPSR